MSNTAWIDKYKPRSIDDLILNDCIKDKYKKMVENMSTPNMIITGSSGIGKSATLHCLAKCIYKKCIDDYVVSINPSMDRNTKYLQEKLEVFCKKTRRSTDYKKLVMIDEIDNISQKSQRIINVLMDQYSHSTSFTFTCNTTSNIIEAIQSKCIIIRYVKPSKEDVIKLFIKICKNENIPYTIPALTQLYIISQGDIRVTINNMQTISDVLGEINTDNILKICDKPNPVVIKSIFDACVDNQIKTAITLTIDLKEKGYTGSDILTCMLSLLRSNDTKMDDFIKVKLMNIIGLTMYNISKGIDSNIQLASCVIKMCDVIH